MSNESLTPTINFLAYGGMLYDTRTVAPTNSDDDPFVYSFNLREGKDQEPFAVLEIEQEKDGSGHRTIRVKPIKRDPVFVADQGVKLTELTEEECAKLPKNITADYFANAVIQQTNRNNQMSNETEITVAATRFAIVSDRIEAIEETLNELQAQFKDTVKYLQYQQNMSEASMMATITRLANKD